MKNVRDFKNIRLSKKQMGNITGGTRFQCNTYNKNTNDWDYFVMEFNSPQDILDWNNSLPNGTFGNCTNIETAHDSWSTNPEIYAPW